PEWSARAAGRLSGTGDGAAAASARRANGDLCARLHDVPFAGRAAAVSGARSVVEIGQPCRRKDPVVGIGRSAADGWAVAGGNDGEGLGGPIPASAASGGCADASIGKAGAGPIGMAGVGDGEQVAGV